VLKVEISFVSWRLRVPFTISRETQTVIDCVHLTLTDDYGHRGRSESIGVDYEGETPATIIAELEAARHKIEAGVSLAEAQGMFSAGGARNALDCALWDLHAKQTGARAWEAAGLSSFESRHTAFTLGMMDDDALRTSARAHDRFAFLKVKTDRDRGLDPVRIVHEAAPNAKLIVDPNEAWREAELRRYAGQLEALNVVLLEQPVDHADDEILRQLALPVPVAADEAFNDRSSFSALAGKYHVINIKLDKTGGLTEALACAQMGMAKGYQLMIGCMAGSSLSMAPASVIAQSCSFIDLDGPLLQADDIADPIVYNQGMMGTPRPALWG
jgi:L-Ala-D/L-Glu epimerase